MKRYMLILACILSVGGCGDKPAAKESGAPEPEKKLSELRLDPALFGSEWKTSDGVVLDSWADISKLPAGARSALEQTRAQMEAEGVIALADCSCQRTVFPLNMVTVRVFKFADAGKASAWSMKKYQYEGWKQHYVPVEGASYFVVDSTQMKKRCVVAGKYWITAHHIGEDNVHIEALESIMKQLGLEP